jgi:hypothetical protein
MEFWSLFYFESIDACENFLEMIKTLFIGQRRRDFYFRAPGSLVVLSFPQLVSFSSVFPKPLSKTVTSAGTAGCPMVEHL